MGSIVFKYVVVGFALVFSLSSYADSSDQGPFGTHSGMTRVELEKQIKLEKKPGQLMDVYMSAAAPVPNRSFNNYDYQFSSAGELCRVVGYYATSSETGYGNSIKDVFKALKDSLNTKYAKSNDTDAIEPSSIWFRPKDWMMSVKSQDRTLRSAWAQNVGSQNLPNGVHSIMLNARAYSSTAGAVALVYEYNDAAKCNFEGRSERLTGL